MTVLPRRSTWTAPAFALAWAVKLAPSAASAASLKQDAAASNAPEARFVVVLPGASLHAAPDAGSPHGVVLRTSTGSLGGATVFRQVADRGEWIEVEAADDGAGDCFDANPTAQTWGLHLFARRADLATVTTRAVDVGFPDGTSAHVAPGVVVRDGAVRTRSLALALAVPDDATGRSYAREAPPPEPAAEGVLRAGTDPVLGAQTIAHRDLGIPDAPDTQGFAAINNLRLVRGQTSTSAGLLVDLQARCVRLRVLVPAESVRAAAVVAGLASPRAGSLATFQPFGAGGALRATPGLVPRFEVRAGTPLTWPDGQPAGRARDAVPLFAPPQRARGRACVAVVLGGEAQGAPDGLRVCFAASALRRLARRR